MNREEAYRLWHFLRGDVLPQYEYPCEHCWAWECKKNSLKPLLKKRYARLDMIDWRRSLKEKKEKLKELIQVMRLPEFMEWSYGACQKCGKRAFYRDMSLHSEWEKKDPKHPKDHYRLMLFRLCPECNRGYVRSKKPLYEGYEKK